jgi:hypothetical protein
VIAAILVAVGVPVSLLTMGRRRERRIVADIERPVLEPV